MKKTLVFGAVIAICLSACSSQPSLQKDVAKKMLSEKYDKELTESIALTDEALYSRLKESKLVENGYVSLPPYSQLDINTPIIKLTPKSEPFLAEHPVGTAKTYRVKIARQVVSEIKSIEIKDPTHAKVRYQVAYMELTPFAELYPGVASNSTESAADFTFDCNWRLNK